jgi:hypothetical protein
MPMNGPVNTGQLFGSKGGEPYRKKAGNRPGPSRTVILNENREACESGFKYATEDNSDIRPQAFRDQNDPHSNCHSLFGSYGFR